MRFQISSFPREDAFKLAACHTYPVSGVEKPTGAAGKKQQAWLFLQLPCPLAFCSASNVYTRVSSKTSTKTSQMERPPFLPSYLTVKTHPLSFFLPSAKSITENQRWKRMGKNTSDQTETSKGQMEFKSNSLTWKSFFTKYYF